MRACVLYAVYKTGRGEAQNRPIITISIMCIITNCHPIESRYKINEIPIINFIKIHYSEGLAHKSMHCNTATVYTRTMSKCGLRY